jgi:hypothetical protein
LKSSTRDTVEKRNEAPLTDVTLERHQRYSGGGGAGSVKIKAITDDDDNDMPRPARRPAKRARKTPTKPADPMLEAIAEAPEMDRRFFTALPTFSGGVDRHRIRTRTCRR